jgi:hypothetical protein
VLTEREVVGVRVEVGQHLVAGGEQRVVRRHREALVTGDVPRGDQVQCVVVGVPVAAHPVGLLETVDFAARLGQGFHGGQPGRAGADHAIAGHRPSVRVVVMII